MLISVKVALIEGGKFIASLSHTNLNSVMLYNQLNILCRNENNVLSLFNGIGADILCLSEQIIISPDSEIKNECDKKLDFLIRNIEECKLVNFSDGIIGLLFLLIYLEKHGLIITETGFYDEFDDIIKHFIDYSYHIGNYDLLNGMLGAGVYYLEVTELFTEKVHILQNIIGKLKHLMVNNTYWRYTMEDINTSNKDVVNLGFLHGIPSILSFFMTCKQRGILNLPDIELIYGMLKNFIKYQIDFKKNSYPNYVFYDKNMQLVVPNQETRLGYCYGDLGIIAMYLKAYKTFEDKYFFNIAKQMLEKIANRIIYENISNDYFCHGISSVFYFVNQFNGIISSLNGRLFDSLKKDLYNRLISVDFNQRSGGILTGYHGIFLSLLSPTRSVALEKILLLK